MHVTRDWQDASSGYQVLGIAGHEHPKNGGGKAGNPARLRYRVAATRPAAGDSDTLFLVEGRKARNVLVPDGQRLWFRSEVSQMTLDIERQDIVDLEYQPRDDTLTGLADLDGTLGLVEQTGPDVFAKRALGVGAGTSVPTTAHGDARWASLGNLLVTATGTTTSRLQADNEADRLSVAHFGADRTGTVDATDAIQSAITLAETDSRPLYFPPGTYKVSGSGAAIFTVTKPIHIYGAGGWTSRIMPATGVPNTRDVFLYDPVDGTNGSSYPLFQNLRISGQSAGVARYGIHFKPTVANSFIRRWGVESVWVQNLGSFAVYCDASTVGTLGIFTGWLRDCVFFGNGFGATDLWDSILIENCGMTGTGYGIDVDFTSIGPGKFIVRGCNITASAGVRFGGPITGLSLIDNYFETKQVYTGANNAFVDLNGGSGGGIAHPVVLSNVFTMLAGHGDPDCLRVNYCGDAVIDNNIFTSAVAAVDGINITGNAARTIVTGTNRFNVAGNRWVNAGLMSVGGAPAALASLINDSSPIADTVAELSFGNAPVIPANTFQVGQSYRIRAAGRYSNTGTPLLTIRIKIGLDIIAANNFTTRSSVTDSGWICEGHLVVRSIGASGSLSRANALKNDSDSNTTALTIDTTAANTFDVTANWGTASPSNTVLMTQLDITRTDAVRTVA